MDHPGACAAGFAIADDHDDIVPLRIVDGTREEGASDVGPRREMAFDGVLGVGAIGCVFIARGATSELARDGAPIVEEFGLTRAGDAIEREICRGKEIVPRFKVKFELAMRDAGSAVELDFAGRAIELCLE